LKNESSKHFLLINALEMRFVIALRTSEEARRYHHHHRGETRLCCGGVHVI
jgi:hypothetical protein